MTARRSVAALVGVLLAGGAIAEAASVSPPGPSPIAARVPGSPAIERADVLARVSAATSPAVASQFTPAEVASHVLSELIGLDLDRGLARTLHVPPDTRAAAALIEAGVQADGSAAAYQQQLIRSGVGGWAGDEVYAADTVLRAQLAAAEAVALTPVPARELQAEYDARLGGYQHAHVQVITTPDLAVATRDAALARADPARFPALARADTDDDTHRAEGGDYGPSLARGQLYKNVDDAIFAATAGEILGPITVAQAAPEYYVVRVLGVVDIPLAAVTAQLTDYALAPDSAYLQGKLTAARRELARQVEVAPDLGTFNAETQQVTA